MRSSMAVCLLIVGNVCAPSSLAGIVVYDFSGTTGAQALLQPTAYDPQLAAWDLKRGSGLTMPSGLNSFNSAHWHDMSPADYVSFGFTVATGHRAQLTELTLTSRSSGAGPAAMTLRSSRDDFASDLFSWSQAPNSDTTVSADLSGLGEVLGATEFRIFSSSNRSANGGAIGTAGTWRIGSMNAPGTSNLMTIGGEVSAISAVPEPGSWLLLTMIGCASLLSKLPTRARQFLQPWARRAAG